VARVPLVGREAELQLLAGMFTTQSVRLVTILGPSGIGKTVVAEEAVRRLIASAPLIVQRVTLDEGGSVEVAAESVEATLSVGSGDVVAGHGSPPCKRLVLVDGANVVADAPRLISTALDSDPDLLVLTTSVLPLDVRGEQLLSLGPLALPRRGIHDPERAATSPAVRLFCDRMRASDPGFELKGTNTGAVVELCIALDGMPLALELAAIRAASLGVEGLLELYRTSGLAALTRRPTDSADRHHSLGRTIGSTYALLAPGSQVLLRRLGVFAGSFDWRAVTAVTADGASESDRTTGVRLSGDMGALVASGLVRRVSGSGRPGEARYVVAQPIRRFLLEYDDDASESGLVRRRHAEHFRDRARELGSGRFCFGGGASDHELVIDRENFSAALAFFEAENDVASVLSLAVDLEGMWIAGTVEAGARLLSGILDADRDGKEVHAPGDPGLLSRALASLVFLDLWSRRPVLGPAAHARLIDATRYARQAGRPDLTLRSQEVEVQVLIIEGAHEEARTVVKEALNAAEELGDEYWRMRFLTWSSVAANMTGDVITALEDAIVARDLARIAGDDHQLLMASHVLAGVPGSAEDARACPPDSDSLLEFARRLGDVRIEGLALMGGAIRHVTAGDREGATGSVIELLELGRRTGTWYLQDHSLFVLVMTLLVFDSTEEAVELHGALFDALPAIRLRLPPFVINLYDRAVTRARRSLGETRFQRLAASGGLRTWSAALDLAEQRALALMGPSSEPPSDTSGSDQATDRPVGSAPTLSRRELEVLRLIASGCSTKDVAAALNLRPKTVMHYTSSLYRRLEVHNRVQAVSAAWRLGLLEPRSSS
jgi:predicted ATPase/DNA-binding CsgD family transcriptional regulator